MEVLSDRELLEAAAKAAGYGASVEREHEADPNALWRFEHRGKNMKHITATLRFLLLLVPRLCIPASFLLAIVFGPILMLSSIRKWPRMLRDSWDDPI